MAPDALLYVAVGAALVALWWRLATWRGGRRRSQVAVRRAARALAGEADAEQLLRAHGYAIDARQARTEVVPRINGEPVPFELRVDYLVSRGEARYVAEVKTGDQAPRLTTAATRRQLLEYWYALPVDGVLLVVPEHGAIHAVEFDDLRAAALAPAPPRWPGVLVAGVVGVVVGAWLAAAW